MAGQGGYSIRRLHMHMACTAYIVVRVVQLANSCLSSSRVSHGHKGKATGAATLAILGDEGIL
jgi:hypothetical protein